MYHEILSKKFEEMGVRLKFSSYFRFSRIWDTNFSINIQRDQKGEFFEMWQREGHEMEISVLDHRPDLKHLLLMVKQKENESIVHNKFLCGHDERFWFVAGVHPKSSTVRDAQELLKPFLVRKAQWNARIKRKNQYKRRNKAFIRQGEWFFIPEPELKADDKYILKHEPIRRGGSKPHRLEYAYRTGGTTVYVCRRFPNGLVESEYKKYITEYPSDKQNWQTMVREPRVYGKGRVTHKDHKTVILHGWHRVIMNDEVSSNKVAFLD